MSVVSEPASRSVFDILITEIRQYFDSINASLSDVSNAETLSQNKARTYLDYIRHLWDRCLTVNSRICNEASPDDYNTHAYFLENQFQEMEFNMLEGVQLLTASLESFEKLRVSRGAPRSLTKLPVISIPKFSGTISEWSAFSDYFKSLVIHDDSIDNLQRLHYLRSSLEGEAASLVKNLPVTQDNFEVAWKILESRYDNTRVLTFNALDALFSLPTLTQESPTGLRKLLNGIQTCIQTLKNLKRPIESCDVLTYLVVTRLDPETRKSWEIHQGNSQNFPSYSEIQAFLESRIIALDVVESGKRKRNVRLTAKPNSAFGLNTSTSIKTEMAKPASPPRCPLFKKNRLCFNCLSSRHTVETCVSRVKCRHCGKTHHSLLHRDKLSEGESSHQNPKGEALPNNLNQNLPTINFDEPTASNVSSHVSEGSLKNTAILSTAWVWVTGNSGPIQARALLDQGSTNTLVTQKLARSLKIESYPVKASLSGIGNVSAGTLRRAISIKISPIGDERQSLKTEALIIPSLTSYIPNFSAPIKSFAHIKGLRLADANPSSKHPIDVIIGADLYAYTLLEGIIKGTIDQPVAQNSIFGWLLSGNLNQRCRANSPSSYVHLSHSDVDLNSSLTKFWETEEVLIDSPISEEEQNCESHFLSNFSRDPSGKYIVRIPFKSDPALHIGSSINRADKLLISLERRLQKKPSEANLYYDFLRDYEESGHMSPCPSTPESRNCQHLYLSHHPVFKHSSTTTKLRVVFNASAPTSSTLSINDLQYVGPRLQVDLPGLICRWRCYKYVLCADIAQMYRQIWVHEKDRQFQRIRWRYKPSEAIKDYQLNTVTFGMASAPFLALRVLKQLAKDEGAAFPLAVPILLDNFYVDDCLFGADDLILAREIRDQLIQLLAKGGFELRKWASNDSKLVQDLPKENHGLAFDHVINSDEFLKILGIFWNPSIDSFQFQITLRDFTQKTKRQILSVIAHFYDPMGWISPIIIIAKIFVQTLWQIKCDWDSEIPSKLQLEWFQFISSLPDLSNLRIPRWMGLGTAVIHSELHGFSDASSKAYASVIYLRTISIDGKISVHLISSKTKVAPLKQITIPRLELCAAVLLVDSLTSLIKHNEFKSHPIFLWSDSTIVIAWLDRPSYEWKTYVANRVSHIHTLFPSISWRHVPGEHNPADLASRGVSSKALLLSSLWWYGPPWLSKPEEFWPHNPVDVLPHEAPERKVVSLSTTVTDRKELTLLDRFSSWNRMLRVISYVLRFSPNSPFRFKSGIISAQELQITLDHVLHLLQNSQFSTEISDLKAKSAVQSNSCLFSLSPFLDSHGILRVGGRLQNLELEYDSKHPIILKTHHIVRLLIRFIHEKCFHGGLSLTLQCLKSRYWVLQAKKIIRSVIHHCIVCTRSNAELQQQLMGSLPSFRVNPPARPFTHCGVDYAGPLSVRYASGRGSKSHPAYIALFICMSVRAIHLEVVSSLSTEAFLAAFKRFVSRRGCPRHMYSDQGTNFKGANSELSKVFVQTTCDERVRSFCVNENVEWHFNPPSAPHFGGSWEAGVKTVKMHLKRVLSPHTPTFEELNTVTSQVEACLNSRPLCALSESCDEFTVLTPAHFLIGGSLVSLPQQSQPETQINLLSRWQFVQQLTLQFWKLWSVDYIQSLQHRAKWKKKSTPLSVGQLVLVKQESLPPAKWCIGRIIQVHPGNDGIVRVVTLRTANTVLKRPIVKLVLLPIDPDTK